jgi:hypothetical protein
MIAIMASTSALALVILFIWGRGQAQALNALKIE